MHFLCSAFEWWCLHPSWHLRRWSISIFTHTWCKRLLVKSTKFNRTFIKRRKKERNEKETNYVNSMHCVFYILQQNSIYISTITSTATANSLIRTHHRHRRHCNSISHSLLLLQHIFHVRIICDCVCHKTQHKI